MSLNSKYYKSKILLILKTIKDKIILLSNILK